jgi:hypothetical protein
LHLPTASVFPGTGKFRHPPTGKSALPGNRPPLALAGLGGLLVLMSGKQTAKILAAESRFSFCFVSSFLRC